VRSPWAGASPRRRPSRRSTWSTLVVHDPHGGREVHHLLLLDKSTVRGGELGDEGVAVDGPLRGHGAGVPGAVDVARGVNIDTHGLRILVRFRS
jgi:hypothetical protein